MPKQDQIEEFLLRSLEQERGGVHVYEAALPCAVDERLRAEWTTYLAETLEHVNILEEVCGAMGLDTERQFATRETVREVCAALVAAIRCAHQKGSPEAAQLIACECVVLAETKEHLDWELLGHVANALDGEAGEGLREACELVQEQERQHLLHGQVWGQRLWLRCLGIELAAPSADGSAPVTAAARGASPVHDAVASM